MAGRSLGSLTSIFCRPTIPSATRTHTIEIPPHPRKIQTAITSHRTTARSPHRLHEHAFLAARCEQSAADAKWSPLSSRRRRRLHHSIPPHLRRRRRRHPREAEGEDPQQDKIKKSRSQWYLPCPLWPLPPYGSNMRLRNRFQTSLPPRRWMLRL